MRGSVQYPCHDIAVKVGICLMALIVFLFGLVWISANARISTGVVVSLEVNAQSLPDTASRGNIYLLDENKGSILNVGRFEVINGEPKLSLRIPGGYLPEDAYWSVQFWASGYSTYRPYAQFINDERLRERFSEIVSQAFGDPVLRESAESLGKEVFERLFVKVQPHFKDITQDPDFRHLMVDVGIQEAGVLLSRGDGLKMERTWVGPMIELVLSSARQWPWDKWVAEIVSDPHKQESLAELLNEMEPYFREALQDLLWNRDQILRPGPEYAPNVRLLWVARRTLFGAREPAITLMRTTGGQQLRENQILTVEVVQ